MFFIKLATWKLPFSASCETKLLQGTLLGPNHAVAELALRWGIYYRNKDMTYLDALSILKRRCR
jgi:hypothetical protein